MPHNAQGGGIYIHFPFCTTRCHYCDFNVYAVPTIPQETYSDAIVKELETRASDCSDFPIISIFLGGGTPSLWDTRQVSRVLQTVREHYTVDPHAEVTMEMNPNETSEAGLDAILEAGCNRVSLGVQSLRDPLLKKMDRRHSAHQAIEALSWLPNRGFKSWSADLIFGLPGQTLEVWEEDVQSLLDTGLPHLSTYNLMVEARTPLHRMVQQGKVVLPKDEDQVQMLMVGRELVRRQGLEPYEISNSARPGHESIHNNLYWNGNPYLGIGAGAHGFLPKEGGGRRQMNIRKYAEYMRSVLANGTAIETWENVSPETHGIELLMTGLRKTEGIHIGTLNDRTGLPIDHIFKEQFTDLVKEGLLIQSGDWLRLTEESIPVSDAIFLKFF
jgi:oxygen-independent coproporphyrinogen III oxidase